MKVAKVLAFFGIMWMAAATGCTAPDDCNTGPSTAITLRVRSTGGAEDITQTARVDVSRNGMTLPATDVLASVPIVIFGTGGAYSIIVHHAGYRDTTVTASVVDAQCGATTVALVVNLTAL